MERGVRAALISAGFVLTIVLGAGAETAYRTEVTPVAMLTQGIVCPEEVIETAQGWIDETVQRMEQMVAGGQAGPIEREMLAFYRGATAGTPRLFFGQEAPLGWFAPAVKRGDIVGLFVLDPYSGALKATPGWGTGGSAVVRMRKSEWDEIETIIAPWLGTHRTEDARLIAIPEDEGVMIYAACPGPAGVIRIDVSSLWSPGGLVPRLLDTEPRARPRGSAVRGEAYHDEPVQVARDLDLPESFTLAVLPTIKDQDGYLTCVAHAAASTREWWECGLICYEGTGNSELYTCDCPKGSQGECECISVLLSREFMHDRSRSRDDRDCQLLSFCMSNSCGQGICEDLWVTEGDMIECNPGCYWSCAGVWPQTQADILVTEGVCTEACMPYPEYTFAGPEHGGCTNGGRAQCAGVCPNAGDPCGDDFRIAELGQIWTVEEFCDGVYHHGAVFFTADLCQPCWWYGACMCDPCPCAIWPGGHAMMGCGYDNTTTPKTLYIQNSWGPGWATGGRAQTSQSWWDQFQFAGWTYWFYGGSTIELDVEPHGITYHRGDTLTYTATVANLTPQPQDFYGLANVTLPNGNPYPGNPIVGPQPITLEPFAVFTRDISHPIPGSAPFGFYGYEVMVGVPPNTVYDEEHFAFTVAP